MKKTTDGWTATLMPPRWARQVDVTFLDVTERERWGVRGREAHVALQPPLQ